MMPNKQVKSTGIGLTKVMSVVFSCFPLTRKIVLGICIVQLLSLKEKIEKRRTVPRSVDADASELYL